MDSIDLDSTNGTVTLRNITTANNLDVNAGASGTIGLNGNLESTAGNVLLTGATANVNATASIASSSAGGAVDLSGLETLALGTNQLTLTSDNLTLPATGTPVITGDAGTPANLFLQPFDAATNITLNGTTATLEFGVNTAGDLNTLLAPNEFIVTLGRTDSTGTLTIGDTTTQTIALNNRYVFRMGNLSGSGDITVTDNTTLNGIATGTAGVNSLEFRAGLTGTFTQGTGTIIQVGGGTGVGGLLFSSNDLVLNGGNDSIQTQGNITFQPSQDSTSIGVNGGAGTFQFTNFSLLQAGFASLTIGSATGTGTVNINAGNFSNSTIIQSGGGGTINVDGQLTGDAGAFLTLNSGTTGTINLNDNIVTEDAAIGLTAGTVAIGAANILLDSTNGAPSGGGGGDITVNGNILDLTLSTSRNLRIDAGAQSIDINGTVGTTASNRLNLLTLNSEGTKTLAPSTSTAIRANRFVTNNPGTGITAASGQTNVGGNILTFGSAGSGGIIFNDNVVLTTNVQMSTNNGVSPHGDLVVKGTLESGFGGDNLTANVGDGSATFEGQIGAQFTPLGDMQVISDDTIEFNDAVFANALQTRNVAGNAASGTTRIGGDITTFQNNFLGNSQLYNTQSVIIDGGVDPFAGSHANQQRHRTSGSCRPWTAMRPATIDLSVDSGSGTTRFDGDVGQTTPLGEVVLVNNNTTANQGIRIASDWRSASLTTNGTGITRFGGGTSGSLVAGTPATQTITTTAPGGQEYNTGVVLYAAETIFDTSDNGNFTAGGPLLFNGGITLTLNGGNDLTVITGDEDFSTGAIGTAATRLGDFEIFSRGTSSLNGDIFAASLTINEDAALPAGYVGALPLYTGFGTTELGGITIDTLGDQTFESSVQVGGGLNTLLANTDGSGTDGITFNFTLNGASDGGENDLVLNPGGLDVTFTGGVDGGDPVGDIYAFNADTIVVNENLIDTSNNVLQADTFAAEDFNDLEINGGVLETVATSSSLDYDALEYAGQQQYQRQLRYQCHCRQRHPGRHGGSGTRRAPGDPERWRAAAGCRQ
ncbi:MAG: hypothetical protein U5P41_09660 [Gammaproteobacteria bacterium]|nr:hypothetical protein [Gammaproteobacteria bacterium]